MPLPLKVQRPHRVVELSGKSLAFEKLGGPKKKSGRGPPTSPTLRPRVLTPRDHFAHRGGGRAMIMHKSYSRCNPTCMFFPCCRGRDYFAIPNARTEELSRSNWQSRISFLLRLIALK